MISKIIKSFVLKSNLRQTLYCGFAKQPKKKDLLDQTKQQDKKLQTKNNMLNIRELTWAQKNGIKFSYQYPFLLMLAGSCLSFYSNPFSNQFYYSLFALEKFTTLLLLINIRYPQNPYLKYLIIGSVVGSAFVPLTLYPFNIIPQFIQMVITLLNDNKKLDESLQLSKDQQKIIKNRIIFKIVFYLLISTTFVFKFWYQFNVMRMEKQIQAYNLKNKEKMLFENKQMSV